MSRLDRFAEDYKKLETLERSIKENLKERLLLQKQGQSTGRVDYLLRSHSDNIKDDVKNFEKLIYLYQNEGHKYPELSEKEKQKRIQKIEELKERIEELNTSVRLLLDGNNSQQFSANPTMDDNEARPLMNKRAEDGEYEDTRGKENRQILKQQKDMIKNQDEHLDQIAGIVQNIKYENQNFGQEVTYQNKMLTDLNSQVDKTHQKMVKVDNKLKELIAKSNQWCLWVIIVVELVILILLVVL
ncbi:syntaxin 8 [Stylonychia lemnae]|uniref:Syntaxin 8 n=1 Tax=Stylonychia lemnae TaxID=5949 RepID=A0A078A5N1_STYLE|nr:syntaxin 8 [Stylonychia lemnae]|eukprot:CDW77210.1 syntaxin 8 [Stylonychia lemnae]